MRTVQDYRWDGEIAPFATGFACLRPSGFYRAVLDGVPRDFDLATRADYEAALRSSGHLPIEVSLDDRPELVAVVQAHWHATGANGCNFAKRLSEHRERFGWETWVMADRSDLAATADAIAEVARQRLVPVDVDVLSVIMPGIRTAEALGEIVRLLGAREGWKLIESADPTDAGLTLLGLRVGVDLGYWSEILGFGPEAPLPHTRRAPFTELAIRAKPPSGLRRNRRAYIADVRLDADAPTMKRWKATTKRWRAERLGNEQDARGKAQITTVVQRSTGA